MTKICFAILAHAKRPCLDELVANLRAFAPGCDVVFFNGGRDEHLLDGFDAADVCPYSEPLKWSKLALFQFGILRWLHQQQRAFDFLVTLDGDMLLIKSGFEQHLETTMKDSAYMAVNFMETLPDTDWKPGESHHYHWRRIWQPIFGTRNPYQCFNPGQAFRREYLDRFMAFPKRDALLKRARNSNVPVLEEMIFPTLAVAMQCNPRSYPGSQVPPARDLESQTSPIRWVKRHSPREIRRHLTDPDAFLLHPVPLNPNAVERRVIAALAAGQGVETIDIDGLQREFDSALVVHRSGTEVVRQRVRAVVGPIFWRLRDIYRRTVP